MSSIKIRVEDFVNANKNSKKNKIKKLKKTVNQYAKKRMRPSIFNLFNLFNDKTFEDHKADIYSAIDKYEDDDKLFKGWEERFDCMWYSPPYKEEREIEAAKLIQDDFMYVSAETLLFTERWYKKDIQW